MYKLRKRNVTKFNEFLNLYEDNALTIEGLKLESIEEWFNVLLTQTAFKKETITYYVTSGEIMNKFLCLTGDNCYPTDITIVSFKLSSMVDPLKTAIPRFNYGGRWFNDIVDNNLFREGITIDKIKRKWGIFNDKR